MAYWSGGKTKIPLLPTADYMAFQADFFFLWMLFQPFVCKVQVIGCTFNGSTGRNVAEVHNPPFSE